MVLDQEQEAQLSQRGRAVSHSRSLEITPIDRSHAICRNSRFFHTPEFDAPVRGFQSNIAIRFGTKKLEWCESKGEKSLMICLAVSTQYRRVMVRRTDILQQHGSRYTYASRGKKLSYCWDSSHYDKISDSGKSANPNPNRNPGYDSGKFCFTNRIFNTCNSVSKADLVNKIYSYNFRAEIIQGTGSRTEVTVVKKLYICHKEASCRWTFCCHSKTLKIVRINIAD